MDVAQAVRGIAIRADSGVHAGVTDTGRGIPPEEFDKIFERFYKIDPFVQGAGLVVKFCRKGSSNKTKICTCL